MLFNSFEFILIFLPIVFFLYYLLNKLRYVQLAKGWLVISSLYFYSYWKLDYLPLIIFSMIFNYSVGSTFFYKNHKLKINKNYVLLFGIIFNILLLGYFKYFDFLIGNINSIFNSNFNYMNIVLPLAISFFTFQQIAYLVDCYKNKAREYDFLSYALFVTFFPQLIAGPIVHHSEMMPQFEKLKNKLINHKNVSKGLFIFTIGLFKKVIIADGLSPFVNQGFNVVENLGVFESLFVSLSYTFQLYFDFSGYTDMAVGIACLFNIVLPQNFNSPYKALSIQDFWRRWHMTLSRFLKDYVYIPLGGNRKGGFNTYRNLFLTFLIGGLWHGASWTFVIWGALHGFALCIHRAWKNLNIKMPSFLALTCTFTFINLTWVIFRADSFTQALKVLSGFTSKELCLPKFYHGAMQFPHLGDYFLDSLLNPLYLLVLGFIFVICANSNELWKRFQPSGKIAYVSSILLTLAFFSMNKTSEFLYFNF